MSRKWNRGDTTVHSHLTWIATAADKVLPPAERAEIRRLATAVATRAADPTLRIGVFGQFSSGKSTLLNALLGARLLPTSARVTTTLATSLRPAASDTLTVVLRHDGRRLRFGTPDFSRWYRSTVADANPPDLRTAIGRIMESGRARDELIDLDVGVAGTLLGSGVVVMDTPGFDALDAGHFEVANRVAGQVDLAIVLIPAGSPGSLSLRKFLHDVLGDLRDRCVFVLTKFRHVDDDERAELQDHITAWLAKAGFSGSPVIRADATDLAVLAHDGTTPPAGTSGISPDAARREARLIAHTLRKLAAERREALVTASLDVLLMRLLAEVTRAARDSLAALTDLRDGLGRIPITDLDGFLATCRPGLVVAASAAARHALVLELAAPGPDVLLAAALDRAVDMVGARFDPAPAVRTLTAETETILQDWAAEAVRRATRSAGDALNRQAERLRDTVTGQYSDLVGLAGETIGPAPGLGDIPTVTVPDVELGEVTGTMTAVTAQLQATGFRKTGGGALAGAAVGGLIFPIVGHVVGAGIGALLGSGREGEQRRLRTSGAAMHETALATARSSVISAGPFIEAALLQAIDELLARYSTGAGRAIQRLTADLRARARHLDTALDQARTVIDEAQRRHDDLTRHTIRGHR